MPLTKTEIEKFRKKLLELKAQFSQIVHNVNQEVKTSDDSKGYSQHQADEGTDDFYRNVSLQVSDEEYKIIRQIDRALEKIDENTYGICDISEEEIPLPRLEAIPYATMTVKSQEMLEKGLFS
ncbi:TraR/DksA family transcriptional regulator [Rhabdochlamydiaceae symbiont of Dictyostelium giganteum]|uniref:TraR/DksA family transcriptional regulator n=1 Tax=Rhabdochlamydiaceae symbiont of Dictyostelium giganteum TaxID=3342349 RepID=UPI00384BB9F4